VISLRFELTHGPGDAALQRFLQGSGLDGTAVLRYCGLITVDVPDEQLRDAMLLSALARHLSFMDLFRWVENGFEDVAFWDRPHRWADVVAEVTRFFSTDRYDVIATLEARGFFIAGVLAHALGKPVMPIRKYREVFAASPGQTARYRNWRGHDDQLWLQELPWTRALRGSRALFVDDVLETGSSFRASEQLLRAAGITVIGAMYLIDASGPAVREGLKVPVRSLLRLHGLRGNTAPALE
jgi:adenine/guanine phosphoribosyltransferase-like PRPP-binding protein